MFNIEKTLLPRDNFPNNDGGCLEPKSAPVLSFYLRVVIEKLAIYDEKAQSALLSTDPLITAASKISAKNYF